MNESESDWQAWYDRHGPALLLFARQLTDSLAEAEDAMHDGFIRFWKRKRQVDDALAYMYRCVRSAALDQRRGEGRRQQREFALSYTDRPAAPQPWRDAVRDETDRQLRAAIEQLPEAQREVLVMKIWGGLTFDQIANAAELPRSTAAARYASAIKTLRDLLPAQEVL